MLSHDLVDDMMQFAQLNDFAEQIITEVADFMEIIVNLDLEYLIFNQDDLMRAKQIAFWMMNSINRINRYHEHIDEDSAKVNTRELERQKLFKTLKEDNEREDFLYSYLLEHEALRKYCMNRLQRVAHSFQRIFIKLTEVDSKFNHALLNEIEFGHWFVDLVR